MKIPHEKSIIPIGCWLLQSKKTSQCALNGTLFNYLREIYREDNIKNCVSNEVKQKEIKKSFWALLPDLFQPQNLDFFAHRHHEASLAIMLDEETCGTVHLRVEAQEYTHKKVYERLQSISETRYWSRHTFTLHKPE
jgi:hypothetical protein